MKTLLRVMPTVAIGIMSEGLRERLFWQIKSNSLEQTREAGRTGTVGSKCEGGIVPEIAVF